MEYAYRLEGAAIPAADDVFWAGLALGGGDGPTFLGLPAGGDGLRLVHTSCRKPHGGARDAMGLIAGLGDPDGPGRPHLAILTGDQIYADDVSPGLFPQLRAIARGLVGRDEDIFPAESPARDPAGGVLRDENGDAQAPYRPFEQSGARERDSHDFGLTSSHPSNQLWLFEEFVAHYLLAWGPALWSAPCFDGGAHALLDVAPTSAHHYAAVASAPLHQALKERIAADRAMMRGTAEAMPDIARAFANVPTLMAFDDHEVTDDWNLTYDWVRTVYRSAAGRRIMADGLGAYLFFQHWGNRPEDLSTGEPAALAARDFEHSATPRLNAETEARLGMPADDGAILNDAPFVGGAMKRMSALRGTAPSAIDWSVRLHVDREELTDAGAVANPNPIALLDARMRRGFAGAAEDTWRIHPLDLDEMLPAPPEPDDDRALIVVEPIPVFNIHLLEHVLQPAAVFAQGGVANDNESWTGAALEALIVRLSRWRRVVLLGGDVHYGFTRRVDLEPGTSAEVTSPSTMIQFCASAAKNSDGKVMTLHRLGALTQALDLTRRRRMLVWNRDNLGSDVRKAFLEPPKEAPALPYDSILDIALGRVARRAGERTITLDAEIAAAYGVSASPLYSYTMELVDDERLDEDRLADHNGAPGDRPDTWAGWDPAKSAVAIADLMFHDVERMGRVISGLPQVGLVSFERTPDGAPVISQVLVRAAAHPQAPPAGRDWQGLPGARFEVAVTLTPDPVS